MISTAIDTFYLTDEQLEKSPSRKDGIDEETETTLRIYGCDLIQESGILLKLPQAAMTTGQVLFHRFYCKKSFGRFDVKKVAASCMWLASKLEECPRKARQVLIVFQRIECRRENLAIEHLDLFSKKYSELKMDLMRTERHLLKGMGFYCHVKKSFGRFDVKRVAASCIWLASKLEECPRKARQVLIVFQRMECRRENLPIEHLDLFSKKYSELMMDLMRTERFLLKGMGFNCHVEHPHKFISNYLVTLGTPLKLRQEAWNLANDSLRTTLCVRFRSEVVACGVVYAVARRFQVPLAENPPWWKAFDTDKSGIDEVCRVLACLYTKPKAKYIPVCNDVMSFTSPTKELENSLSPKDAPSVTDRKRDRDEPEREKIKEYRSRPKKSGRHVDKSRRYSSRDRDRDYYPSYTSREKDRHRHH